MKIGIIGSGTMGIGIAQVAATSGYSVKVYDINPESITKSQLKLEKNLSRLLDKRKINADEKQKIQSNISYISTMEAMADRQLIIEAIVEDLTVKQDVFSALEHAVSHQAIIASNTSSLSITAIAAACKKPERVIGIHFFNPVPLMPLVEIIPALQTHESTIHTIKNIISDWKKTGVTVKDTPGFIVNRIARPFYGEALCIYEEGKASIATIDWALKTLGDFRMGPFELMDFIGNDVNYAVTETIFKAFYYDRRYIPSFTQKRMVEAGYLGRKSGKGYYDYAENAVPPIPEEDDALGESIFNRILVMLINGAADALFLDIAAAQDIDLAMTRGVNYPKGLLAWADEKGISWCVSTLDKLYEEYHEDRYRCSPLLRKMERENSTFFN